MAAVSSSSAAFVWGQIRPSGSSAREPVSCLTICTVALLKPSDFHLAGCEGQGSSPQGSPCSVCVLKQPLAELLRLQVYRETLAGAARLVRPVM